MVDGINSTPPSVTPVTKQRPDSAEQQVSATQTDTSARQDTSSRAAVVVDVAEGKGPRNEVEAAVVEVNRAAANAEAPTTQELAAALNADTVAAALGNTVDIKV